MFCLVWFSYLMAYQPSWVIQCQIHISRKAVVVLFNPYLGGWGGTYLFQGYLSECKRCWSIYWDWESKNDLLLLLSHKSMKNTGMLLDLKNDSCGF